MDVQDHHTSPSGHHEVHICPRCRWPFPNAHPSAKHRRAHNRICGTIEGYTNPIGPEVVSDDDEHHQDDDKETPSPKIDKNTIVAGDGEIRSSFSRSEDELFSDAVTEFADSGTSAGSAHKKMDKDVFFSFNEAENVGTGEVVNAPGEISKVDTGIEVSEKTEAHLEKTEETDSSVSRYDLNRTVGLVKDGVVGPASESQEAKSFDVVEAGDEKGQEIQTPVNILEEAKDLDVTKTAPEVSPVVGGYPDNVKQESFEKLESVTTDILEEAKDLDVTKTAPEVSLVVGGNPDNVKQESFEKLESVTTDGISEETVKETDTVEERKVEASELDHESTLEVVEGFGSDQLSGVSEEVKHEKLESDHKHGSEAAKESEIDRNISVLNEEVDHGIPNEQIEEVFNEPVAVLTEKQDLEAPDPEKSSMELIEEDVKEPITGLIEKEDLGLEKQSNEHAHEVIEKPDLILATKDLGMPELEESSKELIQEVGEEPNTGLTEKEDLGGHHLDTQSNEQTDEVVKNHNSILTENQDPGAQELEGSSKEQVQEVVKETNTVLTGKEDLGEPHLEKQSNDQINEVFEKPDLIVTEKQDLGAFNLEGSSKEQVQEVVKETDTVLTGKVDIGGPHLEKQSNEQTNEVFKKPDSIVTEKQDLGAFNLEGSSKEQIQEVVKETNTVLNETEDLGGPDLEKQSNEQTDEDVKKPDLILIEKQYHDAPELQGSSTEQIQEVVEEPNTVLTEKVDLGGPHLEKQSNEHTDEDVRKPDSVLTEKQDLGVPVFQGSPKEQIQEVVKETDTVLTGKEDLDGPHMEKQSNGQTDEVKKPDLISAEKKDLDAPELGKREKESTVEEPISVFTVNKDLGASKLETYSKDEVVEQKVNDNHNLFADISRKTIVEEGNGKLMKNQDSGADFTVDSSSHNSLEGNWGSVSVLSTASIDNAETAQLTEKSKVNYGKSTDVYEPPSFMTLVEPESKYKKTGSSEVQDSQPPPNSEASQAGWFPTLTKVNNETEGRKRNEEAMAKVTNWNAEKQSTPLKNLLGEAKPPGGKQPEPMVQKVEAAVNPPANDDVASPPKLIDDDKKEKKKVKGRSLWVPFACCSSVNGVK